MNNGNEKKHLFAFKVILYEGPVPERTYGSQMSIKCVRIMCLWRACVNVGLRLKQGIFLNIPLPFQGIFRY